MAKARFTQDKKTFLDENKESVYYAVSRKGFSHRREEKPCQDWTEIWGGKIENQPVLIMAAADGHGDSSYDLSEYGAKIAVKAAIKSVQSYYTLFSLKNELLDMLKNHFPHLILKMWKDEVRKDLAVRDPSFFEIERENEKNIFRRYGTTLMVTLIVPAGVFFCQLGDGDIVIVHSDKNVAIPLPDSNELLGNETHSLTSKDAPRLWRIKTYSIDEPALIIMGTDGLSNCFESDQFQIFCGSLYKNIKEFGMGKVANILPDWLDDASQRGSGDDISIVMAWVDPHKMKLL